MITEQQRINNRARLFIAAENARHELKVGDRLRVTKCPGTKRWITFARLDRYWIVSKSGIADYAVSSVDMINDKKVDLCIKVHGINYDIPETTSSAGHFA